MHERRSIIRTCRSPSAPAPSILGLPGIGYGPTSDSAWYSNSTELHGVSQDTELTGMPYAGFEPKSGWRWLDLAFIVEISTAEFEATGSVSTRRFQTFVRGRIGQRVMMRLS